MHVLALTGDEFVRDAKRLHGVTRVPALAAYRTILHQGRCDTATLAGFGADLHVPVGRIVDQRESEGVLKFLTALADGQVVESVIIPDKGRSTLCVSSQVGCRMGCKFCVTGQMGLLRNLTTEEIVAQVVAARFTLQRPVDNVVFMGMGEPLDNLAPVIQALRVLADQRGLNLAYRRITVSTAGHVDGLLQLAAAKLPNLRLAVSIHAANDDLRNRLVPLNVRYPLARLKDALRAFPLGRGACS